MSGGCLDPGSAGPEPSETVAEGVQRTVSIAGQDSVRSDRRIAIEAEVRDPTVSGSGTAEVRITTTNRGVERALSVSTDGCAILNRSDQGSSPEGLWLRRVSDGTRTERSGRRWVADDLPESPGGFGGYGCSRERYGSGDAVATDYAVFHDGRVDGYLTPGEYRFETEVRVWESGDSESSSPASFEWGFSLALDDPV